VTASRIVVAALFASVAALAPAGHGPLTGRLAPAVAAQPAGVDLFAGMRWRAIGPFRGGRSRAITGAPGQPHVFYTGVVNGGVWKTDDAGRTWTPIFDDQPTGSIGDIAVAPSDPNVVYVTSGRFRG
jgi:hypothetical protein